MRFTRLRFWLVKSEEIHSMEFRVGAENPELRRAARRDSSGSGEGMIVKQFLPSWLERLRKAVNGYKIKD